MPFSDPVADGPAIQRSSERALRAGTTLAGVLDLVASIRRKSDVALVLFSYYNPVLQMGLERFAERAADGRRRWRADHRSHARGSRRLSPHRARRTASTRFFWPRRLRPTSAWRASPKCTSGFLYVISRTGVTGAKDSLPEDLPALVRRVRARHRAAHRGGLRHFAAGTSLRSRRAGRRRRGRLGAGAGDRASPDARKPRRRRWPRGCDRSNRPACTGMSRREPGA